MIRVCIYHYEMGAFRRAWIQTVTPVELIHIQKSEFRRVLILDEDDWYGASAPSILRCP
jgi:hypothetical protein